jgi:hypothetical protein
VTRHLIQRYTKALSVVRTEGVRKVPAPSLACSAVGEQSPYGWQAKDEYQIAPLISSLYLRGDQYNGVDI